MHLTEFHEYAIMIAATVLGFPGKSSKELQALPDCWLNNMAVFNIDRILTESEKKGYIRCKSGKDGIMRYWVTKAGKRAYDLYSN